MRKTLGEPFFWCDTKKKKKEKSILSTEVYLVNESIVESQGIFKYIPSLLYITYLEP